MRDITNGDPDAHSGVLPNGQRVEWYVAVGKLWAAGKDYEVFWPAPKEGLNEGV